MTQDNMLLTQDFDDAVSAMESLSRRHALELASVSDVSPKLEALSACNAENTRLKLKINSLLSQISDIAFVSDSTSETNY
jgi:hypothetical protein